MFIFIETILTYNLFMFLHILNALLISPWASFLFYFIYMLWCFAIM